MKIYHGKVGEVLAFYHGLGLVNPAEVAEVMSLFDADYPFARAVADADSVHLHIKVDDTAALPRWLSIVGIGEDGVDGLSPVARGLIETADIVFGGRRHLGLAAPLIRGAARPWPSPFDGAPEEVLQHRGRQVCVLASGDPFQFGVGAVLARYVDAREMAAVPAPSAFSLAAARLGWSLPQTALLSLHGRSLDLIRPHLHPGARIFALTSDGEGPAALASLLTEAGFGSSRLTVLEALGGPHERIRGTTATEFDFGVVGPLNTLAIEVEAAPGARVLALSPGLADELFDSSADGISN